MNSTQLQPTECPDYFKKYISLLAGVGLMEGLKQSKDSFVTFLEDIPLDRFNSAYAQGKWSIGEVTQHLIDCERVFQYRALYFARDPGTELQGFDHNLFAQNAKLSLGDRKQLIHHYDCVRKSTMMLFDSFSQKELLNSGIMSGQSTSVRALGFIILGHQKHHEKIIKERYL